MAKKETTAAAALEIIISRYGIDTFRDRRRAFALLTDLAPGDANTKDRRRIRQALDSGAAEILLKAGRRERYGRGTAYQRIRFTAYGADGYGGRIRKANRSNACECFRRFGGGRFN